MSDKPVNNPAPVAESTPDAQAEPKESKRMFIDLDGERVDVEELKRDRKKYKAADSKFREAAQARKEVEQFYSQLEQDPESILNNPKLPIKKRELAEKWLMEQLQEEMKQVDPKDRESEELKAKLKKYEDQEAEQKSKSEQAEYQKLIEHRKEAIAQTLSKAMELSPLSKNPEVAAQTLKEMASYMRMCRDANHTVTPEEIAQHVQETKLNSYRQLADSLSGDDLVQALGDSVVKKLVQHHLQKIQASRHQPAPETSQDWQPSKSTKREFIDTNTLKRQSRS